jgi:hypothetical protein
MFSYLNTARRVAERGGGPGGSRRQRGRQATTRGEKSLHARYNLLIEPKPP